MSQVGKDLRLSLVATPQGSGPKSSGLKFKKIEIDSKESDQFQWVNKKQKEEKITFKHIQDEFELFERRQQAESDFVSNQTEFRNLLSHVKSQSQQQRERLQTQKDLLSKIKNVNKNTNNELDMIQYKREIQNLKDKEAQVKLKIEEQQIKTQQLEHMIQQQKQTIHIQDQQKSLLDGVEGIISHKESKVSEDLLHLKREIKHMVTELEYGQNYIKQEQLYQKIQLHQKQDIQKKKKQIRNQKINEIQKLKNVILQKQNLIQDQQNQIQELERHREKMRNAKKDGKYMLEQLEVVDKVGRIFIQNDPEIYNLEKILDQNNNLESENQIDIDNLRNTSKIIKSKSLAPLQKQLDDQQFKIQLNSPSDLSQKRSSRSFFKKSKSQDLDKDDQIIQQGQDKNLVNNTQELSQSQNNSKLNQSHQTNKSNNLNSSNQGSQNQKQISEKSYSKKFSQHQDSYNTSQKEDDQSDYYSEDDDQMQSPNSFQKNKQQNNNNNRTSGGFLNPSNLQQRVPRLSATQLDQEYLVRRINSFCHQYDDDINTLIDNMINLYKKYQMEEQTKQTRIEDLNFSINKQQIEYKQLCQEVEQQKKKFENDLIYEQFEEKNQIENEQLEQDTIKKNLMNESQLFKNKNQQEKNNITINLMKFNISTKIDTSVIDVVQNQKILLGKIFFYFNELLFRFTSVLKGSQQISALQPKKFAQKVHSLFVFSKHLKSLSNDITNSKDTQEKNKMSKQNAILSIISPYFQNTDHLNQFLEYLKQDFVLYNFLESEVLINYLSNRKEIYDKETVSFRYFNTFYEFCIQDSLFIQEQAYEVFNNTIKILLSSNFEIVIESIQNSQKTLKICQQILDNVKEEDKQAFQQKQQDLELKYQKIYETNQQKGRKMLRQRIVMMKCREYQTFFDFKKLKIKSIEENIVDVIFEAVYNLLKGSLYTDDYDSDEEKQFVVNQRNQIQDQANQNYRQEDETNSQQKQQKPQYQQQSEFKDSRNQQFHDAIYLAADYPKLDKKTEKNKQEIIQKLNKTYQTMHKMSNFEEEQSKIAQATQRKYHNPKKTMIATTGKRKLSINSLESDDNKKAGLILKDVQIHMQQNLQMKQNLDSNKNTLIMTSESNMESSKELSQSTARKNKGQSHHGSQKDLPIMIIEENASMMCSGNQDLPTQQKDLNQQDQIKQSNDNNHNNNSQLNDNTSKSIKFDNTLSQLSFYDNNEQLDQSSKKKKNIQINPILTNQQNNINNNQINSQTTKNSKENNYFSNNYLNKKRTNKSIDQLQPQTYYCKPFLQNNQNNRYMQLQNKKNAISMEIVKEQKSLFKIPNSIVLSSSLVRKNSDAGVVSFYPKQNQEQLQIKSMQNSTNKYKNSYFISTNNKMYDNYSSLYNSKLQDTQYQTHITSAKNSSKKDIINENFGNKKKQDEINENIQNQSQKDIQQSRISNQTATEAIKKRAKQLIKQERKLQKSLIKEKKKSDIINLVSAYGKHQ